MTHAEEQAHGVPSLLEPIYIPDDSGAHGHRTRGTESLNDAPEHDRGHGVRARYPDGPYAEARE